MKAVGALLVMLGGVWAFLAYSLEKKQRRETLSQLARQFECLAQDIRQTRTPLPELFRRSERACVGESACFFRTAAQGGELPQSWKAAAAELWPGAREIVEPLSLSLRGDEEAVCQAFHDVSERLSCRWKELSASAREEERRVGALTLSAAALAVILLW